MPSTHLRQVFSIPTRVNFETLGQFYLEQHLREMVHYGVAKTAAFYEVYGPRLSSGEDERIRETNGMPYMAQYQSNRVDCVDCPEFREQVTKTSPLWDERLTIYDVADLTGIELEFVEVLGNYEYSEKVAPYIIHVVMSGDDVEGKLQFDHVNAVSILDGYRRTLLYRHSQQTIRPPSIVLIHEFDSKPMSGVLPSIKQELEAIDTTKDCSFVLRCFSLCGSEGLFVNGQNSRMSH